MENLNIELSPKQNEAIQILRDEETSELGFGGAGNGGKSFLLIAWVVSQCLIYPGVGYLIGRKELTNLKKTTQITFYEFCQLYGLESGKQFTYNDQTHITTWINGSQIFWMDLDYLPSDPLFTRLGSLNLTGAAIDESNEVQVQAVNTLKTRLGRRKNEEYGLLPKLLETFNPDKGHVYQRYFKLWKNGTLPTYRKFIRSLYSDNPYASEDWKKQILTTDKITIERLLKGNFDYEDDPNSMISYDAITDLYSNTLAEKSSERYLVVDAARYGGDRIVYAFWRGLEWYKVIIKQKQGIDETIEDIRTYVREQQIPFSHVLTDEDGVGGGIVDGLRGTKGFVANRKPFDNKQTGKPDNYKSLKDQCAYKLADLTNDHKIAIKWQQPQIEESLNEELSQVKYKDIDKDGKKRIIPKDEMKEMLGRSPDLLDTMIMRMWFELKPEPKFVTDEQPAYVGSAYEYSEIKQGREMYTGNDDDLGITQNFKFHSDDERN